MFTCVQQNQLMFWCLLSEFISRESRNVISSICVPNFHFSSQTRCVWNILTPTSSESQADMMVGTFPKNYNTGLAITGKVDVVANTPRRKTYYCSILIEEVGHLPIRISQDLPPQLCLMIFVFPKSDLYLMFQIPDHFKEWDTLVHQGEHQKRSVKCLLVDHPDFVSLASLR